MEKQMESLTIVKENPSLGLARAELCFPTANDLGNGAFRLLLQPDIRSYPSLLTFSVYNAPAFAIRVDINVVTGEVLCLLGKADQSSPNQFVFWLPEGSELVGAHKLEMLFEEWKPVRLTMDGVSLDGKPLDAERQLIQTTEAMKAAVSSELERELPRYLESYIQGYMRRFNELYSQLAGIGLPAPLYARPIASVAAFEAADGVALFFLPLDPQKVRPDVRYIVCNEWPLSRLLQAVTINLVKVFELSAERIKADLSNMETLFRLPADLPLEIIQSAKYQTLSPELLKATLGQGTQNAVGIGITPAWHVQDGVAEKALPTRCHLFSPMVFLPDGRAILQYQWLFADIFWDPDALALDAASVASYAEMDLYVLRLGLSSGVPLQALYQNPYEAVARQLLQMCQEFEDLLDDPSTSEPSVQSFLEKPAHRFLISPVHQEIAPRKPLGGGKYVPDFTVLKPDGEYHLIEIENPQREIYQLSGEEPAAHLTHAITQVNDWLRYVNDNRDTVRREDGLATIYEPTGEVVAGRDAHLGEIAARRFEFLRTQNRRIALKTYDMLLTEARAYANVLRNLGSGMMPANPAS